MAYLALLEDLENRALRRERVFKERADLFSESTEWLLSRYRFPKNILMDLCRDLQPVWAVTRFLAPSLISNHFLFISESDLSSDRTELTAAVTFSHAALFLLLVTPAFSVPNSSFWLVSTSPTSTSISVSEKFLFFALFAMISVRGK